MPPGVLFVAQILWFGALRLEEGRPSALCAPPSTRDQPLGLSIPCIVSQLTKALNQPVLVVSLGYMPKP